MRLAENAGISLQGCYVLGMGFVLEPRRGAKHGSTKIPEMPKCFSHTSTEKISIRDLTARRTRWVIDFNDCPEDEAEAYTLPYRGC